MFLEVTEFPSCLMMDSTHMYHIVFSCSLVDGELKLMLQLMKLLVENYQQFSYFVDEESKA